MKQTWPLPMATDGQGVILAVPHSVDPRQRASIDLLSRRVSHRLGCPVAVGQVQRGTLHLDAPLADLHAKGAREIVIVPMTLTPRAFVHHVPLSRSSAGIRHNSVTFKTTEPLGGEVEVVQAVIESLAKSERNPTLATRIVLMLPFNDRDAAPGLDNHLELFTVAGWKDARVHTLPSSGSDSELAAVIGSDPDSSAILMPLTLAPGAFGDRVATLAAHHGADVASVSFHTSEALTNLIYRRVLDARRLERTPRARPSRPVAR